MYTTELEFSSQEVKILTEILNHKFNLAYKYFVFLGNTPALQDLIQ